MGQRVSFRPYLTSGPEKSDAKYIGEIDVTPRPVRNGRTVFTHAGKIETGHVEADQEALSVARDMVKGASAVARFDLWQGERCVGGAAPTMRKGKPRR